jgi:hypothetical protein
VALRLSDKIADTMSPLWHLGRIAQVIAPFIGAMTAHSLPCSNNCKYRPKKTDGSTMDLVPSSDPVVAGFHSNSKTIRSESLRTKGEQLSMPTRKVVLVVSCVFLVLAAALEVRAQDAGCQFTGNSACGGDDRGQCAPHERFYSEKCSNGSIQNKCFVDNYCASVNKGRINIAGSWQGNVFRQLGDSLSVTYPGKSVGNGQFIGPYTITITWPGVPAYRGTISVQNGRAYLITWDRPAGNVWRR